MIGNPTRDGLTLIGANSKDNSAEFAHDVQAGLMTSPKRLPCRYFYDCAGSILFEQICSLPEYYLARAEREILSERAEEIAVQFQNGTTLVELGSGSAEKTRTLIEAFLSCHDKLRYIPVDISRRMLYQSSTTLLESHRGLQITAFAGEYHRGLRLVEREVRGPKCILWLGSSIGNLERAGAGRFLRYVGELMGGKDRLLVGIDLRKDPAILRRAYDDSRGVTAKFNRNILVRMNRQLGACFNQAKFRHRAFYNDAAGRVEMHLVSTESQDVWIDRLGLSVSFAADESIHTENCYKYSLKEIEHLADDANLTIERQWFDSNKRFSVTLFSRASSNGGAGQKMKIPATWLQSRRS